MKIILDKLAARKNVDISELGEWKSRETIHLCFILAARILRGITVKLRIKGASGLLLCERGVRLFYPWHIRAGKQLNLEEGCEIVGLSKKGILFGDHCTVKRFATIRPTNILLSEAGEGLKMGNHSNIGAYSYVGCSGYIEIGNNVMMGHHVNLLAENHVFDDVTKPMIEQGVTRKGIVIEDDVWIGANVCVTAGVRIGTGAVIAAGAVVTRDVPPFSISGGIPARTLRLRNASAADE